MTKLLSMPIRVQLFLMALIVALPAAGIIAYSGFERRGAAISKARTDTRKLADGIASEQKILVAGVQQLAGALAQLPEIRTQDRNSAQAVLSDILRINPQLLNIFIADRTGMMWVSAKPSNALISIADRRHFINSRTTGRFSSGEYIVGRLLGKPTLSFGYPYRDLRGEFAGVIVCNIDLEYSRKLLKNSILPEGSSFVLLDHRGVVLIRGLDHEAFVGKAVPPERFRHYREGLDGKTFVGKAMDGVERYITYRKLFLDSEKTPYVYVAASIPVAAVLSPANRGLLLNLALLTSVMLAAFCVAWLIGRRSIVERISIMRSASQLLAKGHLHTRVSELVEGGELGELARSFDDMAAALARDLAERERVEQMLHEQTQLLELEVAERQKAQETLAVKHELLEQLNNSLEESVAAAIADLRRKDQLLIQQSRQAAMGEMIGNIAHQWRQPLNALGLLLANIRDAWRCNELDAAYLEQAISDGNRLIRKMSTTINDFRNFFRPDKERMPFSALRQIRESIVLVEPSFGNSNIRIDLDASHDLMLFGFPNEYSQVLLNLFSNAKEAIVAAGVSSGCIQISLCEQSGQGCVTVRDNGGGIAVDSMDRIFEPYFSTKEMGTGIGLYMSKTIIERNMNGTITARNVESGAEFTILIPLAERGKADGGAGKEHDELLQPGSGFSETADRPVCGG